MDTVVCETSDTRVIFADVSIRRRVSAFERDDEKISAYGMTQRITFFLYL